MSPQQQISVNTLVRSSKYPVSWVISSVGFKFNSADTFIPQQPLTDADRQILLLDQRDDTEFASLCQSVVGLRLLFAVSEEFRKEHGNRGIQDFFPLQERLGKRSVNDMMEAMSRRSASPLAKELRQASVVLKAALEKTVRGKACRYSPELLAFRGTKLTFFYIGVVGRTRLPRKQVQKLLHGSRVWRHSSKNLASSHGSDENSGPRFYSTHPN